MRLGSVTAIVMLRMDSIRGTCVDAAARHNRYAISNDPTVIIMHHGYGNAMAKCVSCACTLLTMIYLVKRRVTCI